jgi:hypothetical protein
MNIAWCISQTHNSEVGEFTSVYLQRLREAAEKAKETENYQAQSLDRGMEINSYTHTQYITTAQYNIIMHYTHGL